MIRDILDVPDNVKVLTPDTVLVDCVWLHWEDEVVDPRWGNNRRAGRGAMTCRELWDMGHVCADARHMHIVRRILRRTHLAADLSAACATQWMLLLMHALHVEVVAYLAEPDVFVPESFVNRLLVDARVPRELQLSALERFAVACLHGFGERLPNGTSCAERAVATSWLCDDGVVEVSLARVRCLSHVCDTMCGAIGSAVVEVARTGVSKRFVSAFFSSFPVTNAFDLVGAIAEADFCHAPGRMQQLWVMLARRLGFINKDLERRGLSMRFDVPATFPVIDRALAYGMREPRTNIAYAREHEPMCPVD